MTRIFRKVRDAGLLLGLLFLGALVAAKLEEGAAVSIEGPFVAVDGDTLAVGGERLRLKGIDAPEIRQTCGTAGREWRCGEDARATLEDLTSGAAVICSGSERDRYERLLVHCRSGALDINAEMVKRGMAVASGDDGGEEAQAREQSVGVWSGTFERPRQWRVQHGMMDDPSAAEGFMAWLTGLFASE